MAEPGDLEDLQNQLEELIGLIEDEGREPSWDEEDLIQELNDLIEMLQQEVVDVEEFMERRERLLDKDPALLSDGEIDSWERWRDESGSP
mgnify:CR=1 FL=1